MRKILIALLAVIVIAGAVIAGGIWFVKRARPDYDAVVAGAPVQASIEVARDSAGVPRVRQPRAQRAVADRGRVYLWGRPARSIPRPFAP